jgi:DDB1- and CUL4-associated factor 1
VNQVICPALNVLVNLVCPPPSISNKPLSSSNQQPAAAQALASESREKNFEKTISDRNLLTNLGESRERSGDGNPAEKNNT